jgi:hypothetical protein
MAPAARMRLGAGMVSSAEELHVLPHERTGGWLVGPAWFATIGEAERDARRRAVAAGSGRIYLHDRYHRVRAISVGARRPA